MQNDARRSIGVGQVLVSLLVYVVSKTSAQERAAFVKAQQALRARDEEVKRFAEQVKAADRDKAPSRQTQHDALETLSVELAHDGFNRMTPLSDLSGVSISELLDLPTNARMRKIEELCAQVEASPRAKAGSKKAARAVLVASQATVEVDHASKMARVERHKAIEARDALVPAWHSALTKLRLAIRYGDEHEGTLNYEKVFGDLAPSPARKKLADPVPAPVPSAPAS